MQEAEIKREQKKNEADDSTPSANGGGFDETCADVRCIPKPQDLFRIPQYSPEPEHLGPCQYFSLRPETIESRFSTDSHVPLKIDNITLPNWQQISVKQG